MRLAWCLIVLVSCHDPPGHPPDRQATLARRVKAVDAAVACADGVRLRFESIEWSEAERAEHVTLGRDGRGELTRTSSGVHPDVPEVGFYRACVAPADVDALDALLDIAGDPPNRAPPSAVPPNIRLNIRDAAGVLSATYVTDGVAASKRAVLERIARAAAMRPIRVLRVGEPKMTIDASGTLAGTFELSNPGVEGVTFGYPRPLAVELWPDAQTGADGRPKPGDHCNGCIAGTPVDVTSDAAEAGPTLTMPAGGTSTFRFRAHLATVSTARYRGRIVLEASGARTKDSGARTTRLLSAPVVIEPPALARRMPDPHTIERVEVTGCMLTPMTNAEARAILERARELVVVDPVTDGWSYTPGCHVTARYASGTYEIDLMNGRGSLHPPSGPSVPFEWDRE